MKQLKNLIVITVIFSITLVFCSLVSAEDPPKININTATVEELVKLDKIGPQYAQRIVEFREKEGAFATTEAIMNVKGIGQQIYEANKDKITVK